MLVYFVYGRGYKALGGAVLAGVFCLLVWPSLLVGWQNNVAAMHGFYERLVAGYLSRRCLVNSKQPITHGHRQPSARPGRRHGRNHFGGVHNPGTAYAPRDSGRSRGRSSCGACGVLRRGARQQPRLAFACEVGLVQIGMLLLSGITWKNHYVSLLLPYSVLLTWLADARHVGPRRTVATLLALSVVLCTGTSDFIGHAAARYAEAYGLIALGAMIAGLGLIVVRRAVRNQARRLAGPIDHGSVAAPTLGTQERL